LEISGWAVVLVFAILLAGGLVAWRYLRRRPTPEEIERLRRLTIHRLGKVGDGQILDVEELSIIYSYSVAGVVYTATQDTTNLEEKLPPERMSMVGPVSVKFDPRNPANSIVLCEEWSGLRNR
jgi:hypothetical protein